MKSLNIGTFSHFQRFLTPYRTIDTKIQNFPSRNLQRVVTHVDASLFVTIALFTVKLAHFHYNKIQHVCEAISGCFAVLARNCLASTLDYIVMQMRKINREKGYSLAKTESRLQLQLMHS